ncbi:MAG: DUF1015 domain-containing protein [Christensenellaceae bacterium]|jgi:hypothetical protein|nr:DUF1015 domain-containing protein [Christensenellaceae bacterium]
MSIIAKPAVLIPNNIDMSKWAVVACDQFCAETRYWDALNSYIGDAPSTLNIIFPELYIGKYKESDVQQSITNASENYILKGFLKQYNDIILVERQTSSGVRIGLVLSIDLDEYNWGNIRSPIRATEDTIPERLPLRVSIRRSSRLETPHTLLLYDDIKKEIVEPLYARRSELKKVYDFELSMHGGHITGYIADNYMEISSKFNALGLPSVQEAKYGSDTGIVFAVGDGNHSMAAAKIVWEELKKTLSDEERLTHPSRFFLAEAVNIYDSGIKFWPIHRMVFGAGKAFIDGMKSALVGDGKLKLLTDDGDIYINIPLVQSEAIDAIQKYIEKVVTTNPSIRVEYVHNETRLKNIRAEAGGVAIVMPYFPMNELFRYVARNGNLPKKAFSIGEPEDKRYYLEARLIRP